LRGDGRIFARPVMRNEKQEALINQYLVNVGDESKAAYRKIFDCLDGLGYSPKKDKSSLSFKHSLHNKQIAKAGIDESKKKGVAAFFSLRFSACRGYSKRFADIVDAYIEKYPTREAICAAGKCTFCRGEPISHVYAHSSSGGAAKTHCGAYAIEIPGLNECDLDEIYKLLKEEHQYLMDHEAR